MPSVEILKTGKEIHRGLKLLANAEVAARKMGMRVKVSERFRGVGDWLCLFGVGAEYRDQCRNAQIKRGGRVACWDLSYFGRDSYLRVSIDHNHPWRDMDKTPSDPERFSNLGLTMSDDYDPDGPVLVIGLGPKARAHLKVHDWEERTLRSTLTRFPDRKILYRPKPNRQDSIQWEKAAEGDIDTVLRGASLVICRHSNVAIDACLRGIPVECEDGAAFWLYRHGPQPGVAERADFLNRVAWWQWRFNEQVEAWRFLNQVTGMQ